MWLAEPRSRFAELRALATRPVVVSAISLLIIVGAAFASNLWTLDRRAFFYADDWTWVYQAQFIPFEKYFHLLPTMAYNDRPIGGAFIEAIYRVAGLDYSVYQVALLCVHAINCILLYAIVNTYAGRAAALLAAVLAAGWGSADEAVSWIAASFDVLAATLCLLALWLRQRASRATRPLPYDLCGAACYLFAVRTKEIALGLILVLLLMDVLFEKRSFRATAKQLMPYLVVFAVLAARYAHLLTVAGPASDSPYRLEFTIPSIMKSLSFYFSGLLYVMSDSDRLIAGLLTAAFGTGLLLGGDTARRMAVLGIAGFVLLLGPVLLIPVHLQLLYLYTPHFFAAMAVGALFAGTKIPAAIGVVLSCVIIAMPLAIRRPPYIDFKLAKSDVNQAQFLSAVKMLTPIAPSTTVFISGVEPFFNPFYLPPVSSLRTAFKDSTITVETERPEPELASAFCQTPEPKRFLRFVGKDGRDVTGEMRDGCGVAPKT